MAYTKPIARPQCYVCLAPAVYEVRNNHNALVNYGCKRHAESLVDRLNQDEAEA